MSSSHDHSPRALRVGRGLGAVALGTLVLCAAPASAQEWSVQPSADLYSRYTDNLGLSTTNPQSAFVIGPSAHVSVSRKVEDLSVTGEAGLGGRFVYGVSNRDYLNALLRASGTRLWERSRLSLSAGYRRDATQVTELEETGVVLAWTQRNHYDASASYGHLLAERWTMNLGYGFTASDYASQSGTTGLRNNLGHSGTAGLAYQLSPTGQLLFNAGASYYRWSPDDSDATNLTGGVAYSQSVSERQRYSLGAGIYDARQTLKQGFLVCPGPVELCQTGLLAFVPLTAEQTVHSTGFTFDASGDLRLDERTSLAASAGQRVNPSGTGTLVRTTSGNLRLNRAFTEKLSGGLAGGLGFARYPQVPGVSTARDSLYWNVSASLNWQLAREWRLDAGARYASVDYSNTSSPGSSAHETSVFATVQYTWPRILLAP